MISYIRQFRMLAVFSIATICGTDVLAAEAGMESVPENDFRIVYHDNYGNIIRRDLPSSGYTFDADVPSFFVALPYSNIAWCTAISEGGMPVEGATVFHTGEILSDYMTLPLSSDLNVYPVTLSGKFIRFDSDGGTPIHYQFVTAGNKVVEPSPAPVKMGYSFTGWYDSNNSLFNFTNTVIDNPDEDDPTTHYIDLKAKWVANVELSYKVHIWLEKAEHPNRTDAADALAHFQDDYVYGGTITKTGFAGADVSFNPNSESNANKSIISGIIDYKASSSVTIHQYYYDDFDGSLAASMSAAAINAVNASGGIKADGSTNVNVYYRRLRYNATIGYKNGGTNVTAQYTSNFCVRSDETMRAAIERHGITVDTNLSSLMGINTFEETRYFGYEYMGAEDYSSSIWGYDLDEYPGGLNGFSFPNPKAACADMSTIRDIPDKTSATVFIVEQDKDGNDFRRQIYLQKLEYAGGTSLDLNNYDFDRQEDWIEGDWTVSQFFLYQYEGFSPYRFQVVRANNRSKYWTGTGSTTYPAVYSPTNNYYPNYTNANQWQVEVFYTRNKHSVTFETLSSRISVDSDSRFSNVYYGQALSVISPYIKHDGESFIAGTTTYTDDQSIIWTFQGWYDNPALEGSPVVFTDYTMPDEDVILYAKWEAKPITVTYNADGGEIQGASTYVLNMSSGEVPEMDDEPIPASDKLQFYRWTLNGVYYDSEPLYDNTELIAVYYSEPDKPLMITYNPGVGTGSDIVEFSDHGYLYNANAGIQPFFPTWTAPEGKVFKHWTDGTNTYEPGDELIMKNDVVLTAVYEGSNANIIISREGLSAGESAIYAVYSGTGSEKTLVMNVVLTGMTSGTPAKVSRTLVDLEPGTYTVEETDWNWAYDKGTTTVKKGVEENASDTDGIGSGTITYNETIEFIFTGSAKTEVVRHSEAVKVNNLIENE